ncbi:very short patch repair endonuclease [Flexibacterium corallicola]|uniref:very short patch repair endonuclease n=1 Tax=Flexibacterium corallicola TaxID=3037259 RepID=UPI00286F9AA2|nr:very short patch repair endonuclease [Pseudovibrio sp. M1P-2-3]
MAENSPVNRSELMSRIGSRDTAPELVVRRSLHAIGYRYRLHVRTLPGTPDVVLPRYKAVIFVHGCFWHCHPGCRHFRLPKSNRGFWKEKLNRNVERDREQVAQLRRMGWRVLTVWECATRENPIEKLVDNISQWLHSTNVLAQIPESQRI